MPKELCNRCKCEMRQKYDERIKPARKKRTPAEPVTGPVIISEEYQRMVNAVLRDKRDRELIEAISRQAVGGNDAR